MTGPSAEGPATCDGRGHRTSSHKITPKVRLPHRPIHSYAAGEGRCGPAAHGGGPGDGNVPSSIARALAAMLLATFTNLLDTLEPDREEFQASIADREAIVRDQYGTVKRDVDP